MAKGGGTLIHLSSVYLRKTYCQVSRRFQKVQGILGVSELHILSVMSGLKLYFAHNIGGYFIGWIMFLVCIVIIYETSFKKFVKNRRQNHAFIHIERIDFF